MADETDLLNDSLSQIGADTITAIDDGSTNANHCQRLYPQFRKALLRLHHWNFAMARAALAQDVGTPAFEFAFSYTLPPNCLKVVGYNGANQSTLSIEEWRAITSRYRIEGKKLLTNDGTALIVFIQDIENPDIWDALFYQACAKGLAAKLATAIPKDFKLAAALKADFLKEDLPIAMAADGQEGSVEPFVSDALLWGRNDG